MEVQKLTEDDVDELYEFLKDKPGIAISMRVKPFLIQCAKSNTVTLFFSRDENGFDNVFTAYHVYAMLSGDKIRKMGYHLVQQYSSGNMLEFLQAAAEKLEGRIVVESIPKAFAEENGWKYDDSDIEMEAEPRDWENKETDLSEENKESAIEMLSEEWFTEEQARDYVETILVNDGNFSKLVIEDGKVIAHAEAAHDGEKAYIEAVYVLKKYRGKGAGKKVCQALLTKLASLGVKRAGLGVDESNKVARALYVKLGFKPTGRGDYTYVMRE